MKCFYCLNETEFNKEHIIPQFLGTFTPINPSFKAENKLVCKNCNSKIFSALETEFKEDAVEGIRTQMLNLNNCKSVRIKGKNVEIECLSGLDKFFDEIFPFLEVKNGEFYVKFMPQIKIRNYADGYQVFLFEAIKNMDRNSSDFQSLAKRISKVKPSDIAIFGGAAGPNDSVELGEIIAFLKECNITYKENNRKYTSPPIGSRFEVSMNGKITQNICRFIAKVAFNYFSFCVFQDKKVDILYESSFDQIKKFILGDHSIKREKVIVEVSDDPITYHEKQLNNRFMGHIIVFFEENGEIFSKITFLGGKIYKVLLGKLPSQLPIYNFGCGHLFNPFDKKINNLTQLPKSNPTKEEIMTTFGMYRRFNLKKT